MKLYNTLTRKVEEFIPNEKGKVKLYTCGPTVYHYAHIGNLRTYIMEDILEKTLNWLTETIYLKWLKNIRTKLDKQLLIMLLMMEAHQLILKRNIQDIIMMLQTWSILCIEG